MENMIKTIISSRNERDGCNSITIVFEYQGMITTEFYAQPELMPDDLLKFTRKCWLHGFKQIISTDYISVWEKEVKE